MRIEDFYKAMKITFATTNNVKFDIARIVLTPYGIALNQKKMETHELQALDVKAVALDKAHQLRRRISGPFLVDDSGFYIRSLHGFPGALLKLTYAAIGDVGLLRLCKGRNPEATFVNTLAFSMPESKQIRIFSTVIDGTLSKSAKGSRKVGWAIERIFIPSGHAKTIAQMDNTEWLSFWNSFSKASHYAQLGKWLVRNKGNSVHSHQS
jgi:XTP/dITP diphosphohydrolase